MTQFNFTTNIEKIMPDTGKVYCIDRMTSDYAEQHPLDVDAFIESVYQEFADTEFGESSETLHSIWTAVLSVTNPQGDASLYPNQGGARRAAAMKVWAKAGDYWRRGLRIGDTLPDMVPMTTITRLGDGSWIALFPKEAHLIEENCTVEQADEQPVIEPVQHHAEPQQLDLFAFEQLRAENERLQAQVTRMEQEAAERAQREAEVRERQRREAVYTRRAESQNRRAQQHRPTPPRRTEARTEAMAVEPNNHNILKAVGYIAAASVAVLVIYETGLIIPLGLIGLATSGLLK